MSAFITPLSLSQVLDSAGGFKASMMPTPWAASSSENVSGQGGFDEAQLLALIIR